MKTISPPLPTDILDASDSVRERYLKMIEDGVAPRLAEMLALRKPPACETETRFSGRELENDRTQTSPMVARYAMQAAKKAGVNTNGKVWKACLGKASDPTAWIASKEDMLRTAKKKGLNLAGSVDYQAPEAPPPKPVGLSNRVVENRVNELIRKEPALARKKREELREQVRDKHTPHWKRKKN